MAGRRDPEAAPEVGQRLRLVAVSSHREHLLARQVGGTRTVRVRPAPESTLPVAGECFALEITDLGQIGARRWLAGPLSEIRLDVPALGLEPLALIELGAGEFELERIPPVAGAAAETELHQAIARWAAGDPAAAEARLAALLRRDLRCLTAHSWLGFLAFNGPPDRGGPAGAQRHYEAGLAIAEPSLPAGFSGCLPWSRLGNRPFLRCLNGRAICLWRRRRIDQARAEFERVCRLDPEDQLAARVALDSIDRS